MRLSATFSAVVVLCALVTTCVSAEDLSRGWGADIDWRSLEDAKEEAALMQKPIMMVIHKTWCGACKALKPKVAASKDVAALSKRFVMVNVEDDEEPQGPQYRPDGGYIPRILFMTPSGDVLPELSNPRANPKYKYYYSSAGQVEQGMQAALDKFAATGGEDAGAVGEL